MNHEWEDKEHEIKKWPKTFIYLRLCKKCGCSKVSGTINGVLNEKQTRIVRTGWGALGERDSSVKDCK
jgi:hypothetical protein